MPGAAGAGPAPAPEHHSQVPVSKQCRLQARLWKVLQHCQRALVGQRHAGGQVLRGQALRVVLLPGDVCLPGSRLLLLLVAPLACGVGSVRGTLSAWWA